MTNQEAIEIIQERMRQMAREREALEKALEALRTIKLLETLQKTEPFKKQTKEGRREDEQALNN